MYIWMCKTGVKNITFTWKITISFALYGILWYLFCFLLLINYTFMSMEIFLFMKIKKFIKNLRKLWKYAKKYAIIYWYCIVSSHDGGIITRRKFNMKTKVNTKSLVILGLMTALTDETIQLFSLGRSSQVTDVWIDFAGVVTGTLLAFLVQAIVRRCKKSWDLHGGLFLPPFLC